MTKLPVPMTKLPVPSVESQALAFARKFVAGLRDSGGPWSGHSLFSEVESRAFVRQIFEGAARRAVGRLNVIALARAGDVDAIDVLHRLIIEAKSRGEVLPVEIQAYEMEVLEQTRHGGISQQSPGPKKKNKLVPHMFIALAVASVIDRFGLPATGRSLRRRSACSIVAEAMSEIGLALGHKAVENIWNKYRGGMPTVPGWSSAWAF
jgi:hypothetical protein